MIEKQKGENCPSSKKRGFDPGALVGGGKGDDPEIKCTNLERQIDTSAYFRNAHLQASLVGGGKGVDDIKYRQIQKSNAQNKSKRQIDT